MEIEKEYVDRGRVKYLRCKIREMKNKDRVTKVRLSSNDSLLKATLGYSRGSMSVDDLLKTIYEIA